MSYCAYGNCQNKYKQLSSISFFNLPKDELRRNIWIQNSGNPALQNLRSTARRMFCENHFSPKLMRKQFNRTILKKDAVPYKHDTLLSTLEQNCPDTTVEALIGEGMTCENSNEYEIEESYVYNYNEQTNGDNLYEIETPPETVEVNIDDIPIEAIENLDILDTNFKNLESFDNTAETHSPSHTKYSEDEHFALSLVGPLQRLPHHVKPLVKLKILQLITEAELQLNS